MSEYEILKFYEDALIHIEDVLGTNETTNQQLENLCVKLFGGDFLGVFSANHWPKLILNNQMFIINNKSDRSSGEHWLSIIKYKNKIYGFDSFARAVHNLSRYWKHKAIINANHERNQSFLSYDCGPRSITFLITFQKYKLKCLRVI